MQQKKRSYAYSGHRWKKWSADKGVRVATFIGPDELRAVKKLAEKYDKAEWRVLRSAINYGLSQVWRRGA
jgi:hypothetical protein